MYNISHSDAEQHANCEWAHHYGYGYNITPKVMPEHLQRGVIFHDIVAGYYDAMKAGYNWDDCVDAGQDRYVQAISSGKFDFGMCNEAYELFQKYVEFYNPSEWEIIWVEEYIEYPATDNIILNGQLDLVIRGKSGKLYNQLGIVDHKVVFNFMTQNEIDTHAQLPKYMYAINKLKLFDQKITFAVLNQVRHRSVKDVNKLFSRIVIQPTEITQAGFMAEYIKQAHRIIDKRNLGDPFFWKEKSTRTLIKNVCKNCDFEQLCRSELEGGNPETAMKAHYKVKDHSYRNERLRVNGQPRRTKEDDSSDS